MAKENSGNIDLENSEAGEKVKNGKASFMNTS